ncbi:hypothetical protein BpHYR1_029029 [Brachionus plicatilis]|uniref:Uncharacterized protein n=1 Tax=Brachionus plicatilis TaxID=10195 RepID=A0A3M7SWU7_BRAPC|nr:hypothetical protein BpHYR1_029029 [Brachionus plicatilis]
MPSNREMNFLQFDTFRSTITMYLKFLNVVKKNEIYLLKNYSYLKVLRLIKINNSIKIHISKINEEHTDLTLKLNGHSNNCLIKIRLKRKKKPPNIFKYNEVNYKKV